MPRSPGYAAARARLIAYRWVPLDHPRLRVRLAPSLRQVAPRLGALDPIVRRSLLAVVLGLLLILLARLLDTT